jgi:hypothetical protein
VLGRDGEDEEVIWLKIEPKYFCKGGWTCDSLICPRANHRADRSTRLNAAGARLARVRPALPIANVLLHSNETTPCARNGRALSIVARNLQHQIETYDDYEDAYAVKLVLVS